MKYTFSMKIFMNFHFNIYIKLKMIVEMENYKFEVKRVTHLKAIDTITPPYFAILYLSWNSFTSLVWCHFWLQILTKKNILASESLKSLIKQENWYLSNKVTFSLILLSSYNFHENICVARFVNVYQIFANFIKICYKKLENFIWLFEKF